MVKILGMISGTSHDGVDTALVDFTADGELLHGRVIDAGSVPYPTDLRARLIAALPPAEVPLSEICALDTLLGRYFAQRAAAAGARQPHPRRPPVDLARGFRTDPAGADLTRRAPDPPSHQGASRRIIDDVGKLPAVSVGAALPLCTRAGTHQALQPLPHQIQVAGRDQRPMNVIQQASSASAAGLRRRLARSTRSSVTPYLAARHYAARNSSGRTAGAGSPRRQASAAMSTSARHRAAMSTASDTSIQTSGTRISSVGCFADSRASK